ncbi:hypothetical protein LTR53_006870, partial [Teratosphaeriaceae sp. CCFEE 6253]
MSRRGGYDDRYDDRDSDYRRPRRDRDYDELDVDITRTRSGGGGGGGGGGYPESRAPRGETIVLERDTVKADRRPATRQPDFLREDYGQTTSGALVIRREERDEDTYSRAPTRRRSLETVRSRAPPERVVQKDELVILERDRGPPYPRSERDFTEKEEIIIRETGGRERARSRPPRERERSEDEIDITIKHRESSRPPPPRSEAPPRSEYRERDVEEIRFRRGPGDAPARPPPMRTEIDREEIRITDTRSPPPRSEVRGRDREFVKEEIDIDIRETHSHPPPRREPSRGNLVARDREEWIVRRKREVTPPPPVRDYEKEEIIIRRRERTP